MKNINPILDLKDYNKVLDEISVGKPLFITDNGKEKYVILDIEEYERINAVIKLMRELSKGASLISSLADIDEVEKILGV